MRVGAHSNLGAATAAAALLLTACAARPMPYVEPSGGPTARLLTRGYVTGPDLYGVFVYDDGERCLGAHLAGAGSSTRTPKATTLAAGKLATVDFFAMRIDGNQSCRLRWSFRVEAAQTYLLSGGLRDGSCYARVMNATDPDNIKPEPSAQRRNVGNQLCVAMTSVPGSPATPQAEAATGEAVLRSNANASDLEGLIKP